MPALPSGNLARPRRVARRLQHRVAGAGAGREGALDEASVDALASRVGVGERQLRRLFQQHLGASPIAVAQSRRVLLAKQLIHETQLPMTEIAMAAGFGSMRRFNDTFQALFKRPPTALRRAGGWSVRPARAARSA